MQIIELKFRGHLEKKFKNQSGKEKYNEHTRIRGRWPWNCKKTENDTNLDLLFDTLLTETEIIFKENR